MPGILVVAETADGAVTAASYELLGAARGLSSQGAGDVSAFIAGNVMTTFHYAGTVRMGEDERAPVDTSLRLRGARGLRVADASITPWTPVSAMNAPSMMIGHRAAELMLAERLERTRPVESEGTWRA